MRWAQFCQSRGGGTYLTLYYILLTVDGLSGVRTENLLVNLES